MNQPAERGPQGGTKFALLVIGYGNELRSDDGVGPKTARAVADWNVPGVRTLTCHQLTPELAVPIASSQCVVFVDASVDGHPSVEMHTLQPAEPDHVVTHAAHPGLLLRMAREIFGRSPQAFWLTIPIENVAFGEGLSERAQDGYRAALKKIWDLLGIQG